MPYNVDLCNRELYEKSTQIFKDLITSGDLGHPPSESWVKLFNCLLEWNDVINTQTAENAKLSEDPDFRRITDWLLKNLTEKFENMKKKVDEKKSIAARSESKHDEMMGEEEDCAPRPRPRPTKIEMDFSDEIPTVLNGIDCLCHAALAKRNILDVKERVKIEGLIDEMTCLLKLVESEKRKTRKRRKIQVLLESLRRSSKKMCWGL